MTPIQRFEQLLAQGQDNALLRFGLGQAYFRNGEHAAAIEHLHHAVRHDPDYSAAWKLLGQALTAAERPQEAIEAYESGLAAAQGKGDIQAGKEMRVFLKRLHKSLDQ